MKLFIRLIGICLLLGWVPLVWSQTAGLKIDRIDIKYVGPATVSEQFIRSHIRTKAGDVYQSGLTEEDIRALYATGQFYNIRIAVDPAAGGGVALMAIQGLNQKVETDNAALRAENAELRARLEKLEQLINARSGGGQ